MNRTIRKTFRLGKSTAKQLLGERHYTVARTYRRFWQQGLQGKQFVFVHTMGKVASSSIVQSLRASSVGKELAVYHTHSLSTEGIDLVRNLFARAYGGVEKLPADVRIFLVRHQALSHQLQTAYRLGRRVKLVTVVREPVATNFSGFFYTNQCWPTHIREAIQQQRSGASERLLRWFLAAYPHDLPLNWFDLELKARFRLDVYAQPFPQEQGYQILHGEQVDLLVLKLDQLNACANTAFSEFLQIPQFNLLRVNEASDQWYAPLYKEFTRTVRLPEAYLDRLYDSQYTQHFYSEAEVANLRRRWLKTIDEPA